MRKKKEAVYKDMMPEDLEEKRTQIRKENHPLKKKKKNVEVA